MPDFANPYLGGDDSDAQAMRQVLGIAPTPVVFGGQQGAQNLADLMQTGQGLVHQIVPQQEASAPLVPPTQHLENAKALDEGGASPMNIWQSTGWAKGADKKWRFEIPDQGSKFDDGPLQWGETETLLPDGTQLLGYPKAKLGDVLDHPDLFKAYPDLANVGIKIDPNFGSGAGYNRDADEIRLGPDAGKSTLLHEVQHAVQAREGFARGSSPDWSFDRTVSELKARADHARASGNLAGASDAENVLNRLTLKLRTFPEMDKLRSDLYNNAAGEVEARNVQGRLSMSPAMLRQNAPQNTADVPLEKQIVFGATPRDVARNLP